MCRVVICGCFSWMISKHSSFFRCRESTFLSVSGKRCSTYSTLNIHTYYNSGMYTNNSAIFPWSIPHFLWYTASLVNYIPQNATNPPASHGMYRIHIHHMYSTCTCLLIYQAPSTRLRVRTYVRTYIHAYISTYIHTYCHRSICIKYIVLLTLCSFYPTHQPTNLSLHSRKLTNQLIHIVIDTHPIS